MHMYHRNMPSFHSKPIFSPLLEILLRPEVKAIPLKGKGKLLPFFGNKMAIVLSGYL